MGSYKNECEGHIMRSSSVKVMGNDRWGERDDMRRKRNDKRSEECNDSDI